MLRRGGVREATKDIPRGHERHMVTPLIASPTLHDVGVNTQGDTQDERRTFYGPHNEGLLEKVYLDTSQLRALLDVVISEG